MVCRCVHVPPPLLAYTMIQLLPRYALMDTQVPELKAGARSPSFRDVGPDLQAVRLAADVRDGSVAAVAHGRVRVLPSE